MSDHFTSRDGQLFIEGAAAADIAHSFGTPTYVYSASAIEESYRAFSNAFAGADITICYAVKANSNLGVLSLLAGLGSGFDIVSVGELERVIRAGGDPAKVVFSGVGKQDGEIVTALEHGVGCFNAESASEIERIERNAARLGVSAPVSIRINPDVDAKTHPYISTGLKENKFGISIEDAFEVYERAQESEHLEI